MVSLAWPAAFDAGRWAVAYWPQPPIAKPPDAHADPVRTLRPHGV